MDAGKNAVACITYQTVAPTMAKHLLVPMTLATNSVARQLVG